VRLERVPGLRRLAARAPGVEDDLVLFDSWHGTWSDNPRAISEALHARGSGLRQVWAADDPDELPDWTVPVAPGGRDYLRALGRARWVVTNVNMPGYFRKSPGTTYLQTWHGTPLKRIAFDIARPAFAGSRRYMAHLRRDVAKWDVLLSPNRFSTDVFRQAFGYEGEIAETGYPRNDVLSAPGAPARRAELRERLGVGPDARVVLYAPTWRDTESFTLRLDPARLSAAAGDDHVVLLRAHHLVAGSAPRTRDDRLVDVTRHPDIRDLYLAADVLLTDYSSAMFDFAITGKPMLFFTYDLAEYRDEVRGFYFDFEAEAPGPLLATTDDVAQALRDLDAIRARYAPAYAAFAERFCHLDDGRASDRVIDAMFGA
jgi:CDP-glycerol glycerophosphotransferase